MINLIAANPELQQHSISKLYLELSTNMKQDGLAKVGLWCMGEFGDKLINQAITQDNVVELVSDILN